jgi:FixJ family two-component response regulator
MQHVAPRTMMLWRGTTDSGHTEMQIALLDDDPGIRDSLSFLLNVAGYEVVAYTSADELLRECQLEQLNGLILDHHMPNMTGLELASRLRADSWRFPILLITAAPSPAVLTKATELGIAKVLRKPFAESDIFAFVEGLAD